MTDLSYRSPKTEARDSPIHGKGLFAKEAIAAGEIVAVKGGGQGAEKDIHFLASYDDKKVDVLFSLCALKERYKLEG